MIKSSYLIHFLILCNIFISKFAYGTEAEQISLERQQQFEDFFSNLEEYSDPTQYAEDKYREAADLISFYTLTVSIFKLVDEIASSTILGEIGSSKGLSSASPYLIEKIKSHPTNCKYFDTEMFDFALKYIELPFKKAVYNSPWAMLDEILPSIVGHTVPLIKQYTSQLKNKFSHELAKSDSAGKAAKIFVDMSFSRIEIMVLEAINNDFNRMWTLSFDPVYKNLKKHVDIPKIGNFGSGESRENLKFETLRPLQKNGYLWRALKILKKNYHESL